MTLIAGAAVGYLVSAFVPALVPVVLLGPVAAVVCVALVIQWEDERIMVEPARS
ncbi:MAG: hypothetical protein HIU88_10010 [Acidobacteria bacterium]|nr:hypothetical protein [Acidobacteriota bacterium]